ncbi:MAG: PIN domain-containing protein [Candidatus Aerophobetes bacterium]|nr:PIN domain-containing protein [Candidatus Aerophobetes bacterium]
MDTNVLVYARDKDNCFFRKARSTIDKARSGKLEACISLQNLSEFYTAVTSSKQVRNPLTPEQAKKDIQEYLSYSNIEKLTIKESTLRLAIELAEKYNIIKQDIYDTQLVATMVENQVKKILMVNIDDFSVFSEIEAENPFL